MKLGLALLVCVAACNSDSARPPPPRDPPRRVIDPPRSDVRALPPHEITAAGIGPYKLAVPMAQILASLPSGPRLAIMQIPGVVDHSLVRDGGLIIGGERQGDASFIAVVKPTIARTVDGVGVGSPLSAAVKGLGPVAHDPRIARDPRLWVGAALPGARLVLSGDRIAAVVIAAAPPDPPPPGEPAPCERKPLPLDLAAPFTTRPACLDGADAVTIIGEAVVVLSTTDGKLRRVASIDVPGVRWVGPVDGGGRDELVAVVERASDGERSVAVVVLALEAGRLARIGEIEAYHLTDTTAAWIGSRLVDLDLRLEVRRSGDDLVIAGVLVHGSRSEVIDVAMLLPVTLHVRRRVADDRDRPRADAGTPPDAEGIDAGAP